MWLSARGWEIIEHEHETQGCLVGLVRRCCRPAAWTLHVNAALVPRCLIHGEAGEQPGLITAKQDWVCRGLEQESRVDDGGFIFFVLGLSGMEGSLRADAGCCSAVAGFIRCRVPGFTPRRSAKLALLATAGAGFSFRSFQLCLPLGLSSSEPVIC